MSILFVEPISTRNWKNKNIDLVVERDKDKRKTKIED